MSRAYRISVSDSRREHVVIDDSVSTPIELLEILPARRMAELLAIELAARGFSRDGSGRTMQRKDGDIVVTVDLEKGELSVRLEASREIHAESEATARSATSENPELAASLKERVAERLDRDLAKQKKVLTDSVAERLDKKLRDLRSEIDVATNRVTAEALKQKAAELGEIEAITEDPETGSITIKVKV
jgi:hypothetical protein